MGWIILCYMAFSLGFTFCGWALLILILLEFFLGSGK